MILIHGADFHQGFGRFAGARSRVRRLDFFHAFDSVISFAIERRPDVFTVGGDLFDSHRPDTETFAHVIRGFKALVAAGVELVVTSGNHETPRSSALSHPFEVLEEAVPGGHFVYREPVMWRHGDFSMVVVPWLWEDLDWNLPEAGALLIHLPWCEFDRGGSIQRSYSPDHHEARWPLVLLGDWHVRREVAPGVWYPGALERTSFGEEGSDTGVLMFEDGRCLLAVDSPARQMTTLDVDLDALDDPEAELREALQQLSDHAIRLRMTGDPSRLDPRCLDFHQLVQREFLSTAPKPDESASKLLDDFGWSDFCRAREIPPPVARYGEAFLRGVDARQ